MENSIIDSTCQTDLCFFNWAAEPTAAKWTRKNLTTTVYSQYLTSTTNVARIRFLSDIMVLPTSLNTLKNSRTDRAVSRPRTRCRVRNLSAMVFSKNQTLRVRAKIGVVFYTYARTKIGNTNPTRSKNSRTNSVLFLCSSLFLWTVDSRFQNEPFLKNRLIPNVVDLVITTY